MLFLLTSCAVLPAEVPTATSQTLPISTHTLAPTPSVTSLSTATLFPTKSATVHLTPTETIETTETSNLNCLFPESNGSLYILNDQVFYYGRTEKEVLDLALMNSYPEWASFKQDLEWRDEPASAGQVIEDASFSKTFQLNPAVTLVTVGIDLDWELPTDGDLFSIARSAGEKLDGYYWDFEFDEIDEATHIKADYPEVVNAATYSIYAFFEYDQATLMVWCDTYQLLFDVSPVTPP